MPPTENDPPKTGIAAKWAVIAAVLAAVILVIDFFTKSIGLFEKVQSKIETGRDPVVLINEKAYDNSSSCLEFAFSNLPENFVLGDIRLSIISADGPDQITGDMASDVFAKTVNEELSPAYLVGQKTEIAISASVQATKSGDAFYLHYCPTLKTPGTRGTITVAPSFLDPSGETISPLLVKVASGTPIAKGIHIPLVRPKNEKVTVVDTVEGKLP